MIQDLSDEAAQDFERILRLNRKKSKLEWNRTASKFKKELQLFQTIENQVYEAEGGGRERFMAHENVISTLKLKSHFHGRGRNESEKMEMSKEEDGMSYQDNYQMRDSSTPFWTLNSQQETLDKVQKEPFLVDKEDLFDSVADIKFSSDCSLHQEGENKSTFSFIPEESCMQIISSEQLNSTNLQLIDQSFVFHDENIIVDSHISESVPDINGKSDSIANEQILIQKYFKEINPTKNSKSNQENYDFNSKIKDLEAAVSDLTRELSKARQQTNKFRKERDEWERKEATIRKEKDQQYEWMTTEMSKLKDDHLKETKRLRKEKKDWETQRKLAEILPTKREREELEVLKNQFQEQFAKWKERDSRIVLAQDRFKKKIMELEKRNSELVEEIRILEIDRTAQKQLEIKFKNHEPPTSYSEKRETLSHSSKSAVKSHPMEHTLVQNTQKELLLKKEYKNVNIVSNLSRENESHRPLKKASREKVSMIPSQKHSSFSDVATKDVQVEAKKMIEFDPAKTDLDQLQRELGLGRPLKHESLEDGTRERNYSDGSKIIWCLDGTMRYFSSDNASVVYYSNGDSKTIYPDKRKVYWYNGPKTKHTTYPDGVEVCEFEDGQIEKRYPDNTLIVEFPDKTIKTITPDGMEKIQYPDGVVQQITENGTRIYTTHPDGVIELVTEEMVSKLYKNGIIKMTFPNGSEETRWPNGQIRIKDATGRLKMSK